MKRITTIIALVALAACDSATGSDRAARENRTAEVKAPTEASMSGGAGHRAVIASVRRRVTGTPGLYEVRGLAIDGGELTVEVRSSSIGFNNLNSGTLVASDTWTGEVNLPFQTAAGLRYLVVAYPSTNGVVDAAHAHYIEAVP